STRGLAFGGVAGLIEGIDVPPAARDGRDAVPAFSNVPPEFVEIPGLRKLARHADHRDRLRCMRSRRAGGKSRCRSTASRRQRHYGRIDGDVIARRLRRRRYLSYGHNRTRRLARQRTELFGLLFDIATELRQRRIAVDLRGLDRRLVLLIDLADPGDAGDRIEPEVDELSVLVEIALPHLELIRQKCLDRGSDRDK